MSAPDASDVATAPIETADSAHRSRAAALPPEARRASILENTVPLLLEHGTALSTRQIAEAAGIAEGTIFRVFPDKESLIEAAVELALDPAPLQHEIAAIDRKLPLATRCEQAVMLLHARMASGWKLMIAVGGPTERQREVSAHAATTTVDSIAALLEPDRAQLRLEPHDVAELLRAMTIATFHTTVRAPHTPTEIVSVLLDGIRTPKGRRSC